MRFSVVMPSFNQGDFIDRAVRSVLQQEDVDFELIIRDALSEDGTLSVLKIYENHPRVRIKRIPDRGQVDALNQELGKATGDVLCWLNSDDVYCPSAFLRVQSVFESDSKVDFVYGDAFEIDKKGSLLGPNIYTESPSAERYLSSHNFICQPTCFFRRDLWGKAGPIRNEMQWVFDYELFGRFFEMGAIGKRIPHFLAANRHYSDTKTNSGSVKRYGEILRFFLQRRSNSNRVGKGTFIYGYELILKALEKYIPRRCLESSNFGRAAMASLHIAFHRLVGPRERIEIEERYKELVGANRWQCDSDWLERDKVIETFRTYS